MIGSRLAAFEITAALGAGGMGEVYRATDTKLGREVAIKVLPADVAGDAERLARFEREAKLLASLNHPNIAHVYGFESATLLDGSSAHFLAMELVEGEDLLEALALADEITHPQGGSDLVAQVEISSSSRARSPSISSNARAFAMLTAA